MKHKVSELSGALLDAAVAKAEGYELDSDGDNMTVREAGGAPSRWRPSTLWEHGGPIIERERINLVFMSVEGVDEPEIRNAWCAWHVGADEEEPGHYIDTYPADADATGPTPLIAAMRAYVASKLGEEVEL